jgi:putative transposase
MLSDTDFQGWIQRIGLGDAAKAAIEQVRTSPPSRHVRSAGHNVSGRFPSRKMGVTIQFESHRVELAAIYLMEHAPDVLEFYDQPPAIKLAYQARNGRSLGVVHTPDFFTLRDDAAGWEEWKPEEELIRLAEKMPGRYTRSDDQWRCPPGERWAEPLGLYYRVRSSEEINWVFQRNIAALEDYIAKDPPSARLDTAVMVQDLVGAEPGMTLADVLSRLKGAQVDDLYSLIADGVVYVDLYAEPLAEPSRAHLFRDAETARAYLIVKGEKVGERVPAPHLVDLAGGASVQWDGRPWTIANVGEHLATLIGESGQIVELQTGSLEALIKQGKLAGLPAPESRLSAEARRRLTEAGPADLREANRRHDILAPWLAGDAPSSKTRTIRHWLRLWRQAGEAYGSGFIGLLPRHADRGNRRRKLPENTLALMDEFIRDRYETLKQKRRFTVYAELLRECQERGVMVPSYKTFSAEIDRRPRVEQIHRRQGPRAAYAYQPFHWELTLTTPRHGDRPFEIGHIDHTELDVELVCATTGQNLGRPWLTLLVDAYSRRLLAVYLTFDAPSYRSAMMALRECVRRHGRLPRTVVVDGGREFGSVYFETFLARFECVKKTRPPAKPRFGSVCERLFGTANTEFVHNLVGNTQIMRQIRQVTKSVNPKQHAGWTLERLYERLCEWAYEVYDTRLHPALGMTPRDAFAAGLTRMGDRAHRRIPYDEDFLMATLPTTRKGQAKVDSRVGVKINYLYYWSGAFRDPEVEGRQVPVRYDPFNMAVAYAFVRRQWVRCISEHYPRFEGRSEREVMLASEELHGQKQHHTRSVTISARKLADFLSSIEAEESLRPQRLRDAASKAIYLVSHGSQTERGTTGEPTVSPTLMSDAPKRERLAAPPVTSQTNAAVAQSTYEDY